ncbi:hypothetical protein BGW42_003030 [Actinomortierella wolfii]|nr:hypothetical protein BGW42_003030 [Actinomortierella wolfii]
MAIRTQKAQQASHFLKYVDDQADEEFEGHGHTLPTVTPNTAKFVPSPSLAQMTGNPTTVTTAHFSQGLPEKKRQWCSDFGSGKVERKSMSSPRTHHTSQDNTETRAKRVKSEETRVSKQDEKEESAQELSDIEWDLEYAEDIFQYLLQRENELAPAASYTTKPREHWRARTICVDMIVHLVSKSGALDEAIFLAVNYMDRFFSTQPMFDLEVMVLVSGICVWLALKFDAKQALYPLHYLIVLVQQYMQRRYTRQDFLQGEQKVLKKLQYELGWPGPLTLLRWAARADGHTSKMQASSAFLLEISLQPPSLLVAAAMGIARYVAGWPYWDERLQDLLGYKERVVIPVSKCMIRFLHDPITTSTCSFRKYSTENLGFVMDELFAAFD